MLPREWIEWAESAASPVMQIYGLNGSFAARVALLYICLWGAGLNPRITSGWRDPARQKQLQKDWDAGKRAGLRVRPATNSQHSITDWLGRADSRAVDMPCDNDKTGAEIATRLGGIGSGLYFKNPDPGHYYAI